MSEERSHWDEKMFPWSETPRFYPPGQHPAMARSYEQLRQLRDYRGRVPDSPELLEAIAYYEEQIAAFEEVESEEKQWAAERIAREECE